MEHIRSHPKVQVLLARADEYLEKLGYTDHGTRHAELVSRIALNILQRLDYSEREQRLAEIAGYLHDIGNCISRQNHAQTGALIAFSVLGELGFRPDDTVDICTAIGNHHEDDSQPVSPICAALAIADKTDVHKSRVRGNADPAHDVHDRVNWAVQKSFLEVNGRELRLLLEIDEKVSSADEFLGLFSKRMAVSDRAAQALGCAFHVYANGKMIL